MSTKEPHEKRLGIKVSSQRLLVTLPARVRRFSVAYVARLSRANVLLLLPSVTKCGASDCPRVVVLLSRVGYGGLSWLWFRGVARDESMQRQIEARVHAASEGENDAAAAADDDDASPAPFFEKSDDEKAFILSAVSASSSGVSSRIGGSVALSEHAVTDIVCVCVCACVCRSWPRASSSTACRQRASRPSSTRCGGRAWRPARAPSTRATLVTCSTSSTPASCACSSTARSCPHSVHEHTSASSR
jgi:hypothetical protein